MTIATLRREVERLRQEVTRQTGTAAPSLLAMIRKEPTALMTLAKMTPDPWQAALLRSSDDRILVLCSRQCGKSQTAAVVALKTALVQPKALVLLLAPSVRQSGELALKVFDLYDALGQPIPARKRTELQLHLTNRSRIIALPESEKTIRGYSNAALLVIDEAARVSDALFYSVKPMLGVSKGRLIALSTPFGKRGWFYEEWAGPRRWQRYRTNADQCPRLTTEFLAEERDSMGERWYRQEYCTSFEDSIGAVFAEDDIAAALSSGIKPLFGR